MTEEGESASESDGQSMTASDYDRMMQDAEYEAWMTQLEAENGELS